MKILKLVCLGIMAGVVFAGTAHVPGALGGDEHLLAVGA